MLGTTNLCGLSQCLKTCLRQNSNRASITRINRNVYAQMYPTLIVNPDGSTYRIKYSDPRRIIRLPVDINTLSEEEKLLRLANRKPKQKIIVEQEIEDNFDVNRYSHLWKK